MSKPCWLAVICLPVILVSLEANADETSMICSSATLEVKIISSNPQQDVGGINERPGEANETLLAEVANIVKTIASSQQENAREIQDQIRERTEDLKKLLTPKQIPCDARKLSAQALLCE